MTEHSTRQLSSGIHIYPSYLYHRSILFPLYWWPNSYQGGEYFFMFVVTAIEELLFGKRRTEVEGSGLYPWPEHVHIFIYTGNPLGSFGHYFYHHCVGSTGKYAWRMLPHQNSVPPPHWCAATDILVENYFASYCFFGIRLQNIFRNKRKKFVSILYLCSE
jgi:hypothetical protein